MKTTLLLLILIFAMNIEAQNKYPEIINAGTSKTVTANRSELWIITGSQMDSVLATGMKYKICDSLNRNYKLKIDKLKAINTNLTSINDTLEKAYIRYSDKWKTCDVNLEKTEKKLLRQKRLKYIFGGSGFAAGLILALLLF